MRGVVDDLLSPVPLGTTLPAVYQEHDPFTMALTLAVDDSFAPIFSTIDNLPAYFDTQLAPDDFVEWLAEWIAVDFDDDWDGKRRRTALANGVDLHSRRGTSAGLKDQLVLFTDGTVDIQESGGTGWSSDATAPLPGSADPALVVRVWVPKPEDIDRGRLDALIASAKPAHVPHAVEILKLAEIAKPVPAPESPTAEQSKEPAGAEAALEQESSAPEEAAPPPDGGQQEPAARSPHTPGEEDEDSESGLEF